jgi:hypothetical protein
MQQPGAGGDPYGVRHGGQARWGEDSIYFDHSGKCRHPDNHRHCPGRWRGVVSLKSGPDGKRRRKKVSGRNNTEVRAKLAELHDELNDGVCQRRGLHRRTGHQGLSG